MFVRVIVNDGIVINEMESGGFVNVEWRVREVGVGFDVCVILDLDVHCS